MHSVASVAPVGSSRQPQAVTRVNNPAPASSVRGVKATGNTQASSSSSPTQSAPQSIGPNLPVGLLLSVSQPSSSNSTATTDYDQMQNDLRSGNVTAAQQAYLRLQTDLLMTQNAPVATEAAAGHAAGLNVTA